MKNIPIEPHVKFEVIYEDDESVSIWKYNLSKFKNGPIDVEYRWKRSFNPWDKKKKTIGQLSKEMKKK